MKRRTCKNCGNIVSFDVERCPTCGYVQTSGALIGIVGGAIGLAVFWYVIWPWMVG